jgi:hypothetical protein
MASFGEENSENLIGSPQETAIQYAQDGETAKLRALLEISPDLLNTTFDWVCDY